MADLHAELHIEDRIRIQDVIFRWCRAIDRREFSAIHGYFHEDAFDDHVFYRGDIMGLVKCLKQRHDSITFSMHAVSNILIEFSDPELALVESYVKVTQRRPVETGHCEPHGSPHDSRISEVYCRYVDRFEKRKGEWKIAHRTLLIDTAVEYSDREPFHRIPEAMSPNRGHRDQSDTVYRERQKLGLP